MRGSMGAHNTHMSQLHPHAVCSNMLPRFCSNSSGWKSGEAAAAAAAKEQSSVAGEGLGHQESVLAHV